ncbi:Mor transcription activator family protein [Bordetella pseudohinzii]|uniref:Uncharacterized conserved protein n=2 Tax=Bordetella pseudohinzii TaxID=1331258 RepID=A0A0M7CYQ0_9BORD|nr:Mor transcription activator family protein [Bordetella pseudohinzii]KXA75917.1 hypothetical protein AW877_18590 [Bordetella pseudohinzii]KXA78961.1 hypothetical protein AW878_11420 [Bordetella pseudohinzii]CUI45973.1 Uncharacterized conserved protein [Bordetella pseudohinzii]
MERPNSRMSLVRHELFSDLVTHVETLLRDLGLPPEIADQAAAAVADFLADHWGGQYVLIPKDFQFKLATRDLEMYRSHRGDFSVTARKWGMTERGTRKVIERVMKRLVAQNQGRLFDDLP